MLWLPAAAVLLVFALWLLGAGRQNAARADEPLKLYLSSNGNVTINGVTYADEDVAVLDTSTGQWQKFLDGSDLGLAALDLDALEIMADGSLLLSVDANAIGLPNVGDVSDADILRFVPTTPGNYGAGTLSLYVDGSDVDLTTSGEDIDAIALATNGDLLISTLGTARVPSGSGTLTAPDEDMLRLHLTQTGTNTSGTWQAYFDGSDVRLATTSEDIGAAWLDPASGDLFLSTLKSFSVTGLKGTGSDVFICQSFVPGANTSCTFGPNLFWDGAAGGFGTHRIDALAISGDVDVPPPPPPTSTPPAGATATPTATPRPGGSTDTEMLIYDWNKPVTVNDKGMPRDNPPWPSANGNWNQPKNFAEGTLYFRVEIFGMPVTKRMQTQFCVWQDAWAREQCAARSVVFAGTNGTVITWSATIDSMWKLPGSEPIDWSRARQIWGYVIRTEDGKPVHPKFNWSGQNTAEWFPLNWRASAVVVEKGKTFSGWANYID